MISVITIDDLLPTVAVWRYTPALTGKSVDEGWDIAKFNLQISEKLNVVEGRLTESDALSLFDVQCMLYDEHEIIENAIEAQDKLNELAV